MNLRWESKKKVTEWGWDELYTAYPLMGVREKVHVRGGRKKKYFAEGLRGRGRRSQN